MFRVGHFFRVLIFFGISAQVAAQEDRTWESIGPKVITSGQVGTADGEVVGAINSIALHPTDADEMFIASVNGGVWRTRNATDTSPNWEDLSDNLPSLSLGAVAYDTSDTTFQTVLAGAGRYSSLARRGGVRFGLVRSTDGGDNWTDIDGTALDGNSINSIAANGNQILVSTGGSVTGPGLFLGESSGGIWQWTQISGRIPAGAANAVLPAGTTYEVVADPTVTNQYYTLTRLGLYRATLPASSAEDTAWTKVSVPSMDIVLSSAAHGRVAIGPSGEVFVAMSTPGTVLSNLWRSPDGSTGWQTLDTPISNGFGNWFLALVADPLDGNVVYVGGGGRRSEFRIDSSLASGSQSTAITLAGTASSTDPHADVRDMRFDAAGTLIEANDGGVYKQTSPTDASGDWFSLNGDLVITETHNASWDGVSHIAIVGTIDNGTNIQDDFVRNRWLNIQGGDGGDVAVDDTGSTLQSERYTSSQRLGNFRRRTYDQNNVQISINNLSVAPPLCGGVACFTPTFAFTNPVAVNTINSIRLVIGGTNGVYESTDQGQNIVQLNDGGGTPIPGINNIGSSDPIAVGANGNADALYLGISDDVWVRTAGGFGGAMTSTDPSATRFQSIVDVVIHPLDDQTAFAIDSGAVFWTSDAGANWTDISGNITTSTTANFLSIAFSTSNTDGAILVGTDDGVFIARGDGSSVDDSTGSPILFTDWAQLGVGLPPTPVYDLEYDEGDELLIAGTLGQGVWALNMEELSPIDVALVMDKSGSMGDPACVGCDSKMSVLQDAAELFVQTWQTLSAADDRIAGIFFDSNIDSFSTPGGDQLVPLSGSGDDLIAYLRSQTDGGATAMGGGTQTATNLLTDSTRQRNIVLFTDGMQNRDPMIELNGAVYEIRDTGGAGSGVSPTVPPTQLDTALDITLSTIGVGVTPTYEAELQSISGGTDGLHKSTTNADADLRRFYIENLVDVLRTSSPQLIEYRYTTSAKKADQFYVDKGSKKVVFAISWDRKDAEELRIKLVKDEIDMTEIISERRSSAFYDVISFSADKVRQHGLKLDGDWQLILGGQRKVDVEVALLTDHGALDYEVSVTPSVIKTGRAVEIAGELDFNGLPYGDGISIRAKLEFPQISLTNLIAQSQVPHDLKLLDDETHAEAKLRYLLKKDPEFLQRIKRRQKSLQLSRRAAGRFTGPFSETTVAGVYKITYFLSGRSKKTGKFTRQEERYFVVEPGTFKKGGSTIKTIRPNPGETGNFKIRILPRDEYGNLLGADRSDAIKLSVTSKDGEAKVSDINDGWYEIELATKSDNPTVTISIDGAVVAVGLLGDIDTK